MFSDNILSAFQCFFNIRYFFIEKFFCFVFNFYLIFLELTTALKVQVLFFSFSCTRFLFCLYGRYKSSTLCNFVCLRMSLLSSSVSIPCCSILCITSSFLLKILHVTIFIVNLFNFNFI